MYYLPMLKFIHCHFIDTVQTSYMIVNNKTTKGIKYPSINIIVEENPTRRRYNGQL